MMGLIKKEEMTEDVLKEKESKRAEAATLLERRMAAMDAALKSMRAPQLAEKPSQEERAQGADLRFGQQGGGTGVGAGAGDGTEIFLQVRPLLQGNMHAPPPPPRAVLIRPDRPQALLGTTPVHIEGHSAPTHRAEGGRRGDY